MPRPSMRLLVAAPLLAILALAAGCSDLSTNKGGAYLTGDGQIKVWPTGERGKAVTLEGETLDGRTWSSVDVRGKPVVVNVWWSNCGPCRTEMPMLQAASTELAGTATFVGVNTRDNSAENGLSYERAVGVSYPSLYSPDGAALLALPGLPRALPSTIILDAEGRIAASINGPIDGSSTVPDLVECIASGAADDHCKVSS